MTTTTKKPIAYSGNGSAVDNYFSDKPTQGNWAGFTPSKPNPQKRKVLFSLLYQAGWTTALEHGEIPDLKRLSDFLQSEKSPVKKKLLYMDIKEMEKLIRAFKGIVNSRYK